MRKYRLDNKLSQQEMSEKLSISQQQYSVVERDLQEPTVEFVRKYKALTGINLLTDKEQREDEMQDAKRKIAELRKQLQEKNEYVAHLMDENKFLRGIIMSGGVTVDKFKPAKVKT